MKLLCAGKRQIWQNLRNLSSNSVSYSSPWRALQKTNKWTTSFSNQEKKAEDDITHGHSETMPTDKTQRRFGQSFENKLSHNLAFGLHTFAYKITRRKKQNIDDFLALCRLQAQKCKFRDEREMEERIIDQIIAGTKFPELQKQLLSKNETMSMSEVLDTCRSYEASINYMRQMDELQGKCHNQISAIKRRLEDTDNCGKCGITHKNGNCPARGSMYSPCVR